MFIRPQHKKQYKEMLDALIGQSVAAADVPAENEDQQRPGKAQTNELKCFSCNASYFLSFTESTDVAVIIKSCPQ